GVVDVLVHHGQKNNRERFSAEAFKKLGHRSGVQKIAIRRSDRQDSGAFGGEMLAEKLANITVLPDQENISTLDQLAGIKRVRVHLSSRGRFRELFSSQGDGIRTRDLGIESRQGLHRDQL